MTLQELLQQLVNGLSVGSIYALIALGYTMVYGILRLINFAHGDVYMVGAFIGFWQSTWLTQKFPYFAAHPASAVFVSVPTAMIGCALLGVLIERLAYRPLRQAPRYTLLITAIGVSFLLEYVMMLFVGPTPQSYTADAWLTDTIRLGGEVTISRQHLIIIGIAVGLMVALELLVKFTRIGKAMRAVATDQDAARLMGINVDGVISFTFALGSALAGVAGVLIGMMYQIAPLMGVMDGLKAFVAAVLGGIGLIPGAVCGAFVLAIVETLVKGVPVQGIQLSLFADGVAFAILILILLLKPSGLLGKHTREKV
jgi:branched-chain amino acid transport system permease protein